MRLTTELLTPRITYLKSTMNKNIFSAKRKPHSSPETSRKTIEHLYSVVSPRSINLPGHSGQWLAVSTAFLLSSQPGSILR